MNFKQYNESITPEPFGLTDVGCNAITTLEQGVANKAIYNVDFVESKEILSHRFQNLFDITRLANRPEYADPAFYSYIYTASIDGVSGELHNINSFIKSVTKFLQYESPDTVPDRTDYHMSFQMTGTSDDFDTFKAKAMARRSEAMAEMAKTWDRDRKLAAKLISEIETWKPVAELVKQARAVIVKGRKPPQGHSDAFRPSPAQSSTSEMVGQALLKVVDEQKDAFIDRLVKYYTELTKKIVDRLNITVDKDDVWREANNLGVNHFITNNWNAAYKLREQHVIVDYVTGIVNRIIGQYVSKNVRKIAPILDKKGTPTSIEANGGLEGWGFRGSLVFKFDDGTGFTVKNKAVRLWNTRRAVEQFPTTFHNAIFSNGKIEKFVSEQDMNERWITK
jgi:hypothetical protein